MNNLTIRRLFSIFLLAITAASIPDVCHAQVMDTRRQVDTLSVAERLSLRTNMIDWTLMLPNIGIEFDLRNTNWSRYAININLRGRFKPSNTFDKPITYAIKEARVEGRMYWRERQAEPYGVMKRHTNIFDKLMSCRRMNPHHPKTTYYRGVYISYTDFDMRIPSIIEYGKRGKLVSAGITWGFVRPLYGFSNGNSLDFECGLSIGVGVADYDYYKYYDETGENTFLWHKKWDLVRKPIVSDLRVGFVYRLGKYPVQKKYRWRYDVDLAYRTLKDASYTERDMIAWQKHQNDSLFKVANREFRHLYDSITAVHAKEQQEQINQQAAEYKETLEAAGGAVKEKSRAEKKRDKLKAQRRREEADEERKKQAKTGKEA